MGSVTGKTSLLSQTVSVKALKTLQSSLF